MPPLIIAKIIVPILKYWGAIIAFLGALIIYLEYNKIVEFTDVNEILQPWVVYVVGGLIFLFGSWKFIKQYKLWHKK